MECGIAHANGQKKQRLLLVHEIFYDVSNIRTRQIPSPHITTFCIEVIQTEHFNDQQPC